MTDSLTGIVKNMFKLLDKWGRRIRGKPITLNEIFICIDVIVSVIFGIIQIKRTKVMSISHAFINADESELDSLLMLLSNNNFFLFLLLF